MTETEKPQGVKTFIGNLAYATTTEGLNKYFGTCGIVVNAVIITRRGRSLGYGFVDFETKDQAEKAVATLNGSELDQRKINVELAKPRDSQNENQSQNQNQKQSFSSQSKRTKPRNPRKPAEQKSEERYEETQKEEESNAANEDGFVEQIGRRRRIQQARNQKKIPQTSQPSQPSQPSQISQVRKTSGGNSQKKAESTNTQDKKIEEKPKRKNNRRKRTPRPAGDTPTDAGLFVANIPYSLDDEGLKKTFEDKGFTVTKYRVVKLPNGKSRGYGFVDLKDSEEQKKAVEVMDKSQVDGREISVKVAMVKPEADTQQSE